MSKQTFVYRSRISAPADKVFHWHARPGAFDRLVPPWEDVRTISRSESLRDGAREQFLTRRGLWCARWKIEHSGYVEGRQFRDQQIEGPFQHWTHVHRFVPDGEDSCWLEDEIEYQVPGGALGEFLTNDAVRRRLLQLFAYRHATTEADLCAHRSRADGNSWHVIVTGASGLIGAALIPFLTTGGHRVTRLVRSKPEPGQPVRQWDPYADTLDPALIEDADAIIHLAGENIAGGRWSNERRQRIWDSRVKSTRLLCETIAKRPTKPRVFICASGTGIYGDGGDAILTEASPGTAGFFADLIREWEAATEPAQAAGVRVVNLRIGTVLSPRGGALGKILPVFRWGLGVTIEPGNQYVGYVSIDDLIGAIHHAWFTSELNGPVNVVMPPPYTQREFTETLSRVIARPAFLSLPPVMLRLMFSPEMAEATLWSQRIVPQKLTDTGYRFRQPTLEVALRHVLGRNTIEES